jgi:hypothetical protein
MSKDFPCFRCERLYAEMEQAELCERSHIGIPKPAKRLAVRKREAQGKQRRTRAQVVAAVWRREHGICQRCGKDCIEPRETYPTDPDRGEVHEPEGRVTGAHLDADRCELLCHGCHMGGPSGAHAPTAERMVKR